MLSRAGPPRAANARHSSLMNAGLMSKVINCSEGGRERTNLHRVWSPKGKQFCFRPLAWRRQHPHVPVLWLWASYLLSLNESFLIQKIGGINPSSEGCWDCKSCIERTRGIVTLLKIAISIVIAFTVITRRISAGSVSRIISTMRLSVGGMI